MRLTESIEDYLEAILLLSRELGNVRSIDLANRLNYKKPSISVAVKNLKEKGLINIDENKFISLTDSGLNIATNVYERHQVLTKCLKMIGVSNETALHDACLIEHVISEETFEALKNVLKKHNS